ncbi:MAG: Pr6Pr family membrane protein [Hyphomonadaceae bacterium]
MTVARGLALLGAAVAIASLAVQFVILVGGMIAEGASPTAAVWRYFGYFTILTNCAIAAIWLRAVLAPNSRGLNDPRVEAAGAAAIIMVGIVYHLLLAHLWDPQGWQRAADIGLHTVTPIVFALYWLSRPHGALKWVHAALCMIWPLGYCLYALARGALDGWYAYPFLNPTTTTLFALITNIAGQSAGFFVAALVLVAIDKVLSRAPMSVAAEANSPPR